MRVASTMNKVAKRSTRRGIFLVAFLSIIACGGGGGGSDLGGDGCGALGAKIFNGDECSQTSRSPVVALVPLADDGQRIQPLGICTATLVTVDDILTSAHCFTESINIADGYAVLIGSENPEVYFVTRLSVHPFFNGTPGSPFDLAMATINQVPNPAIGPVPILVSQLTEPGQEMSTFGYGTNNLGQLGTLKSAEITITALQVGPLGGNLIATLDNDDASLCEGDSGGPVVQIVNGVSSIVGVNSFTAGVPGSQQCAASGAPISGFVDLQYEVVLNFIQNYAPDVAFN